MEQTFPSLGACLKAARLAHPWTQTELAEQACIDGDTISRYETGEYAPSVRVIEDVTVALGTELLFGGVEWRFGEFERRGVLEPGFRDVSACLADARRATGWGLRRLSIEGRISKAVICRYEQAVFEPQLHTIERVVVALDINLHLTGTRWFWSPKD